MDTVDVQRMERVGASAMAADQLEIVGKGVAGQRGRLVVGISAGYGLLCVVPSEVGAELVAEVPRRGVGRQRHVARERVAAAHGVLVGLGDDGRII